MVVSAPGYSAQEIERQITSIAEEELSKLPEIEQIQSVSSAGESDIWLKLKAGADADAEINKIAAALSRVADWPEDAWEPRLRRAAAGPVLLLGLDRSADQENLDSAVAICRTVSELKMRLERVPHVAEVFTLGETNLRFEISVDRDKLQAAGLTMKEVKEKIQQQFIRLPEIRTKSPVIVRNLGNHATIENLESTPIRVGPDGVVTMLRDVAQVRRRNASGDEFPQGSSNQKWPKGWVLFGIHVDSDKKASDCFQEVQEVVASFQLPAGMKFVPEFEDSKVFIDVARTAWSRFIPPDRELQLAKSTDWGTHFNSRTADLLCRITGPDLTELRRIAEEVGQEIKSNPQVSRIQIIGAKIEPELAINVDREKAAELGLTTLDVAKQLQFAISDQSIADVKVDGLPAEVLILGDAKQGADGERLSDLPIFLADGKSVPFKQIGSVKMVAGPAEIRRVDRRRSVSIRITNMKDAPPIGEAIRTRLSEYETQLKKRQPAYRVEWIVAE